MIHRYIISLIILFAVNVGVFAKPIKQTHVIDSLENVISHSQNPYTLINSYSELCWILRSNDPENALMYGNKAIQLINKNIEFDNLRAKTLNFLGVVSRNKGDYSSALDFYFDALKKAKEHEDNIQIAYSNNNIGGIFTLKGNYTDAIEYLENALHFFKKENNISGMGYTSVNLGNLCRHTGDVENGINYFDQAIAYKKQINDTIGVAISMNLKAITLYDNGQFNEAHKLYLKTQNLYLQNDDIKGLSVIKNYLGLLETRSSKYHKAIEYFKESVNISKKIKYRQGIALGTINMAIPYHKIGNSEKAISLLLAGNKISRETGELETTMKSYKYFSEIYYDLKDYKLAFEYQKKYQEALEKNLDLKAREKVASLRVVNELDRRKRLTENLEKRTELLERNVSLAEEKLEFQHYFEGSLVVIIILILIPLIILIRKNRKKISHNEDLINENIVLQEANDTRERFLSIIGHDLKNPFNTVLGLSSLVIEEWNALPDNEKFNIINEVNGSSNSIYELMDNLLLWAKNQSGTIKVHQERFDMNENIIDVYEIFRNQATFKRIKIDLNIGSNNYVYADPDMLNTILRNLISNAVKFTRKDGNITIELKKLANEVEFSITDNGRGIPPDDLKKILDDRGGFTTKGTSAESGTGLGLLVVRDFVKKNNGVFWIESKVGVGSRFCFTLADEISRR